MTTFKFMTAQPCKTASKKTANTQHLDSQKEKLIALATAALKANPNLTKAEFIQSLNGKDFFYTEKTICNYLINMPFSTKKRKYLTRGQRVLITYEKGYQTATLGMAFHQSLPINHARPQS